jgi:transcription initiation factor TFIID TATA-box-binding protein
MKKSENSSLKIENIVLSGSIADSIDLGLISDKIPDCTFDTRKFPGAVYRMQNPKSAALIFESGKIVLTGFGRSEDIPVALQYLQNKLKEAGITCLDNPQVAVRNLVCSYNLGYKLNLNRIVITLMDSERVEYEPEVFPGLVLRISEPKIVFLIFGSGKIIITGGTNMDDVEKGITILLEKFSVVDIHPGFVINKNPISETIQSIPVA